MESECPEAVFDKELELEGWNMFDKDDEEGDLSLSVRKTLQNIVFKLPS